MSLDKLEKCKEDIQRIDEKSFNAYILNFTNSDDKTEYTSYKLKFDKDRLQQISLSMVDCFINIIKTPCNIPCYFNVRHLINSDGHKIRIKIQNVGRH